MVRYCSSLTDILLYIRIKLRCQFNPGNIFTRLRSTEADHVDVFLQAMHGLRWPSHHRVGAAGRGCAGGQGAVERDPTARTVLTFDDGTGAVVDLDLRGSTAEVVARLEERSEAAPSPDGRAAPNRRPARAGEPARGRGRPKLGVVAHEVTLLPRHWEWLSAQRGGASAALRRLVDEARRSDGGQQPGAGRARDQLPLHGGDGRRSARVRGSGAGPVRRRSAALRTGDRRLAGGCARLHAQARRRAPPRHRLAKARSVGVSPVDRLAAGGIEDEAQRGSRNGGAGVRDSRSRSAPAASAGLPDKPAYTRRGGRPRSSPWRRRSTANMPAGCRWAGPVRHRRRRSGRCFRRRPAPSRRGRRWSTQQARGEAETA